MLIIVSGGTYRDGITTRSSTGGLVNADSTPVVAVYRNGTADGTVTPTVTSVSTGVYKYSFTVPSYTGGDVVQCLITATVLGVSVAGWTDPATVIDTTTAQMGVNVVNIKGTASAGDAGYVGLDWGHITGKTTTNALTGTTIASTQKVDVDTIKTNPVVNAGTVTFPADATVASTTNITAGTITTATNLTTNNDKTGYSLSGTQAFDLTGNITGNLSGSVASVVGSVGSVTARVTANTDQLAGQTVTAATGVTFPASVGTSTLTQTEVTGGAYSVQSASCVLGDARIANLDAAVSTRQATFTSSTGVTLPATVASTTNITAGTITTVTNLTNAPTAGDFTAAMKLSLDAATPAVTVSDKTGFSLADGSFVTATFGVCDFTATMKASINTEADTALSDYGPLKPTTAGRTLDVSLTGEAGIDLANVGGSTTVLNLSGLTIKAVTDGVAVSSLAADVITAASISSDAGTEVAGAVWASTTRTLTSAANITSTGGTTVPQTGDSYAVVNSVTYGNAALKTLIDTVDTTANSILTDTNELQTDWVDGGRLDLILDARASQTSVDAVKDLLDTEFPALTTAVDDLPTNAELATALAGADDAVLAAIAALNNISTAQVNAEVDTALSDVGLTTVVTGRIDAAVSSRMATYVQPTGFLAATFPTTVASPTNITAGTITTVTNLTNAPTAGDFTAAMKLSLDAATPVVTVSDKTGFSLSSPQTFDLTGDITGSLSGSVGAVNTVAAGAVTAVSFAAGAIDSTVAPNLDVTVSSRLAPTTAGRTLDVSLGGEAGLDWANIGSPTTVQNLSGTSTRALEPTTLGNTLDVTATGTTGIDWGNVENQATTVGLSATTVGLVTATASVTGNVDGNLAGTVGGLSTGAATDVENAVWDAVLASHTTAGTAGAVLNATGSVTDPWTISLPGSYPIGSAGYLIGTNLDATVSSRSTLTQGEVTGGAYSIQSASCVLGDARVAYLDAAVTSRMATYTQPTGFLTAVFPSDPADQSLVIAATDAVMARLGTPVGVSVSADVAAVKADTGAVKAKTDNLPDTAIVHTAGKLWVLDGNGNAVAPATDSTAIKAKTDNLPDTAIVHTAGKLWVLDANGNAVAPAADSTAIKTKTDFLPSATAGSVGGVFVAGTNAATTITGALTTTFTGDLTGSVASVVGSVGALASQAKADVNAEVADVLTTDTYAEPTGAPAATASLAEKIGRLYQIQRNKITVSASAMTFFSDTDTALWSKLLSDDGTTYQETEGV